MRRALATSLLAILPFALAGGQAAGPPAGASSPVLDSIRPPATTRTIAVRRDAILPHRRVIAYYGNPLSTRMGILGELPPDQMMRRLEAIAAEWSATDSTRPAMPALHLIVTVAQAAPGGDGMYRLRHGDALIERVATWAESKGWLLFLDVQVGRSTVAAELPRLIPWLKKPWVHLALDPEFAMAADQVPGKRIGTLDARDINHAQALLARLVDEGQLPPKILVVHRFTERMVTNHREIDADPRVQVVIDMDGFGTPALKRTIYDYIVNRRPVQFAGLKLFYKNDKPMLTPREVLTSFFPTPVYIQYQ
ncbi:MAG TPA: hypothetical protein VFN90_01290 [Gemmatimonadales bacterium]|nr:hypothetical protein [Gemmatimonadales bacterium]